MGVVFEISGESYESKSGTTPADAFRSIGRNPSAYVFILDGHPVPMDQDVPDGSRIVALKVASGG